MRMRHRNACAFLIAGVGPLTRCARLIASARLVFGVSEGTKRVENSRGAREFPLWSFSSPVFISEEQPVGFWKWDSTHCSEIDNLVYDLGHYQ